MHCKSFVLLLLLGASACTPVCRFDHALPSRGDAAPTASDVPQWVWNALLLRGTHHDCLGTPLPQGQPLAAFGKRPQSLVFEDLGSGSAYVWLRSVRTADGGLGGPVARVAVGGSKVHVESLGSLTLGEGDVAFSRQLVGGHPVLVVRAQNCSQQARSRSRCRTQLALLVEQDRRLQVMQVHSGGSIQPGIFDLERHERLPLHGVMQETSQQIDIKFRDGDIVLYETIRVEETGARGAARLVRRGEAERILRPEPSGWMATVPPLWGRLQTGRR